MERELPNGQSVKLWDDDKIYFGAEICKKNSARCYGLPANNRHLLVREYGDGGSELDIVIFKRL